MPTTESKAHRRLLFTGVWLAAGGPVLGFLCLVAGMLRSFQMIEGEAVPTPAMLAKPVEFTMVATIAGLVIGAIGIALVVLAVLRRPRSDGGDLHKAGVAA